MEIKTSYSMLNLLRLFFLFVCLFHFVAFLEDKVGMNIQHTLPQPPGSPSCSSSIEVAELGNKALVSHSVSQITC